MARIDELSAAAEVVWRGEGGYIAREQSIDGVTWTDVPESGPTARFLRERRVERGTSEGDIVSYSPSYLRPGPRGVDYDREYGLHLLKCVQGGLISSNLFEQGRQDFLLRVSYQPVQRFINNSGGVRRILSPPHDESRICFELMSGLTLIYSRVSEAWYPESGLFTERGLITEALERHHGESVRHSEEMAQGAEKNRKFYGGTQWSAYEPANPGDLVPVSKQTLEKIFGKLAACENCSPSRDVTIIKCRDCWKPLELDAVSARAIRATDASLFTDEKVPMSCGCKLPKSWIKKAVEKALRAHPTA